MNITITQTGEAHGFGRDKYKWVSRLTPAERAAVKAGDVVLIPNCPPSGGGSGLGTRYRQVHFSKSRWFHRVPKPEILAQLDPRD